MVQRHSLALTVHYALSTCTNVPIAPSSSANTFLLPSVNMSFFLELQPPLLYSIRPPPNQPIRVMLHPTTPYMDVKRLHSKNCSNHIYTLPSRRWHHQYTRGLNADSAPRARQYALGLQHHRTFGSNATTPHRRHLSYTKLYGGITSTTGILLKRILYQSIQRHNVTPHIYY